MTALLDYVNDARPYRTVLTGPTATNPVAIVCKENKIDNACRWFQKLYGRSVDFIASDNPNLDVAADKRISLQALRDRPDIKLIVYGTGERALSRTLAAAGLRCFSFAADPAYRTGKFDVTYLRTYRDGLEQLFTLLADEESRLTLASVIKHRITSDHGHLRIAPFLEYEHPLVRPLPGDWVVDCGAYDGATSFRFAEMVGSTGKVYAFEPDPANVARIKAGIATLGPDHAPVKIVNAAVSGAPGKLRFGGGQGGSSKLTPDGELEVDVTTLNDFARSERLTGPGVLSFDIEGFEPEALQGSLDLIRRLKPKLQISAYHLPDHLFSLALWLNQEVPGYRFYMGHHDSYHSETDIYAVYTGA